MLFVRFQGTPQKETSSWYIDLQRLYEDSAYLNEAELYKEWEFNLRLRNNIEPKKLLKKVLSCSNADEVHRLSHKFKVDGVFSYNAEYIMLANNLKTITDLVNFMILNRDKFIGNPYCRDRMVQNSEYLIVFEGDLIYDFGADGCLTRVNKILTVRKFRED